MILREREGAIAYEAGPWLEKGVRNVNQWKRGGRGGKAKSKHGLLVFGEQGKKSLLR